MVNNKKVKIKFKRGAFNFYLKENFAPIKQEIQKEQQQIFDEEKKIPSWTVFSRAREKFKVLNEEEKKVRILLNLNFRNIQIQKMKI